MNVIWNGNYQFLLFLKQLFTKVLKTPILRAFLAKNKKKKTRFPKTRETTVHQSSGSNKVSVLCKMVQ